MKSKLAGILGSAVFCAVFELVVNLYAYGADTRVAGSLIIGAVVGLIVGALIAVTRPDRPFVSGVVAGSIVMGIAIAVLAMVHITAVDSLFSLALVAATVVALGVSCGLGYRVFGSIAAR